MIGPEAENGSLEPRVVITDGGKVGIGSDDPKLFAEEASDLVIDGQGSHGLTISSGADGLGNIRFANGKEADSLERGRISYNHASQALILGAGGEDHVWLTQEGKMGLGTVEPKASFQIHGGSDASLAENSGYLVLGSIDGRNMVLDNNEVQARNNGVRSSLYLQAHGGGLFINQHRTQDEHISLTEEGRIGIGTTSPKTSLHIASGQDANLNDASGYLVIGATSSGNLVIDNNEIQARDNGAESTLHLQAEGGDVVIHGHQNDSQKIIVTGEGHLGIGVSAPSSHLHVRDFKNLDANDLNAHIVTFENTSSGTNADVLALKVGHSSPGTSNNFITFFGGNSAVGSIERNAAGSISFNSSGADFAEYLPRLDPKERIEPGDVIGIISGKVTRRTDGAQQVLVVTSQAVVIGNCPVEHERDLCESVAMVGQVRTKVRGPVKAGEVLISSGLNDGTAMAVPIDELLPNDCSRVVGRSWESNEESGVKLIVTSIGGYGGYGLNSLMDTINEIKKRLVAVEDQLACHLSTDSVPAS